jgi:hypothetical protein
MQFELPRQVLRSGYLVLSEMRACGVEITSIFLPSIVIASPIAVMIFRSL